MRFVYSFFIHIYSFLIGLAALFNSKAALLHKGRKQTIKVLENYEPSKAVWFWFHAASLGEFEQGRPLIEALRSQYPRHKVLLSFFSPSGFEIRKNYPLADLVIYLPADTPIQATIVLNKLNICALFLIKYEFWFNHIAAAHRRKVPVYLISGRFRKEQLFFKSYGAWFRKHLSYFDHFFVQDSKSFQLLQSYGFLNASVTGDTRFDRVKELINQSVEFPDIIKFKKNEPLIVAGSTWPEDEKLLFNILPELPVNYKVLIAPHDISEDHLSKIEKKSPFPSERLSAFANKAETRLVIVDSIGKLSQLYKYARFAYVGGGFGKAIHNIQEAVVWGCPVVFGPNHKKFSEAVDLIKLGGAFAVKNNHELYEAFNQLIHDDEAHKHCAAVCIHYVAQQAGATDKILEKLKNSLYN